MGILVIGEPIISQNLPKKSSQIGQVREIILAQGWNSTSYQVFNPGIEHWFSAARDSVVGFVSCGKVRVVAGAPICEFARLKDVSDEFETDAARDNKKVCYFCAEARLESVYADSKTHAKFLLGAQPVWNPHGWAEIIAKHKSLRAQLNRARNKGVKVAEWTSEKAQNNLALVECLSEWLAAKGLPPLRFLVEPNTLGRLFDRRIFVAEQDEKVVGFVLLSPVSNRNGWLFEQFIHRPNAPNGTVELMIDAAMRELAKSGYDYATLGLAPLSMRANIEPFDNPLWLRVLFAWIRAHGRRFYNFEGLDNFKAKLQPESWEPVFAISNEPKISFKTIYAIASAFSGNAPIRLFLGGLWRAFSTEMRWLKQRIVNRKS